MARTEARIRTSVWRDQEFKDLDASAQGTYWMVLSQADVNMAGVVAYMPDRWATFRGDPDGLDRDLRALEAGDFLVIDRATHEVWVRSFAKNDGALRSPKTRGPMWSAWASILSPTIRRRFLEQLDDVTVTVDDQPIPAIDEALAKGWVTATEVDAARNPNTPPDTPSGRASDTPSLGVAPDPRYPQADTPPDTPPHTPRAGARAASASSSASTTPLPHAREQQDPTPPTPQPHDEGGGSPSQDQPLDPDDAYGLATIGRLPDRVIRKLNAEPADTVGRVHQALADAHRAGIPPGHIRAALDKPALDTDDVNSIGAVAITRIRRLIDQRQEVSA